MIYIYKIAIMSIIVLVISTITIFAITGDAVDLNTDRELIEMEGCPYLENGEHAVTIKGSVSALISGCGYINYNSSDIKPQTYSLWFENKNHVGPYCSERGMEYFHFYCLSKPPSPSADIKRGRMFISKVWPYDEAANNTEVRRCALYEKVDDYDTTLRVAISKSTSCKGLSDMLHHPELIPWDINGGLFMIFNTKKLVRTTTSTESIQSISKRYERRGYILQNFGNRSNPFHRKIRETKDDDKRTRRALKTTSDGDNRHGAVMDLASYDGFQSDINEKDGTTKDKNWLRRPLAINHMQLRRRRSKSNAMPTSKTDDVVLMAGANPFALLLANRLHDNKTGSLMPLGPWPKANGLWDQIKKIFIY